MIRNRQFMRRLTMLLKFSSLAALLWVGVGPSSAAMGADYEYSLKGNPENASPSTVAGGLALMGGGGRVPEAFRWLVKKAGGGDIVVLKASAGDADERFLFDTIGGCDSVESLTFTGRSAASDPKVLDIIANAEGVFIAGGKQYLYADYWKGTPVAEALDRHVQAGKPLGGSSAGLAILGQACYTAHRSARVTSDIALADPFDERLTFECDFLHFELLRGVVTDSHLTTRNRLGRLVTFVARHSQQPAIENLVGIGVDEKTALCLSPDGRGEVFSSTAEGRVWLVFPPADCIAPARGQPLNCSNYRIVEASPQSRIQLLERTVENPASQSTAIVENGVLRLQPLRSATP